MYNLGPSGSTVCYSTSRLVVAGVNWEDVWLVSSSTQDYLRMTSALVLVVLGIPRKNKWVQASHQKPRKTLM